MSRNMIYLANSLDEFGQRCYIHQAKRIDITFSAPIKNRTLEEIDRGGDSVVDEGLIIVPLEIKCLGIATDSLTCYKPQKSFKSGNFAYYYKPLAGNTLASDALVNLEQIGTKAERYAKLVAMISKEYAEVEQQSYDFKINLFLAVLPYGKPIKILELPSSEVQLSPQKEDYALILANERQSHPWL